MSYSSDFSKQSSWYQQHAGASGTSELGRHQSNHLLHSLSSSVASEYGESHVPVALADNGSRINVRARRSNGSFANTFNSLRRSLSRGESFESGKSLSQYVTSFSVREIYGDMPERDIDLERSKTRATILSSLSHRVQSVDQLSAVGKEDEESLPCESRDTEEEEEREKQDQSENEIQKDLYKDVPDIPVPTKNFGGEFSSLDPELITWDGEDDPLYPRNWPFKTKVLQTFIVSIYTLISPMSSSVCSPAMNKIAVDLHMETAFIKSFSVSIMVLAWALGPIVIAPLSESDKVGRRWVLNVSIWIIFIFNLACAFAKTTTQLCVFRFLGGLGGCAALNVGAGTLADLWDNKARQFAMAAYSISPSIGPVISPVISGFIVQNCPWKWVFIVLAIFNGVVALYGTLFFKETYSPKLLKLKAQKLRKETGNEHLHTIFEIANGSTNYNQVLTTMTRPLILLFTHPMILGLGSFMAFIYGFMYLMLVTFPEVFEGSYGFSVGIAGLMFVPMGIGYVLGTIFWSWLIDKIYTKLQERNNGVPKPEFRLPCLCFSGVGIPVGLFWYGWSAQKQLHWIMPSIGSFIFAFSFVAVFQTIQNYLIDMNTRLSASSIAAAAIMRSVFGFALPLVAHPMYDKLHYGWGNTMCGLIALALGVPFPLFCLKYGERIRNWANKRTNKQQAEIDAKNLKRLQEETEVVPELETATEKKEAI